MSIKIELNGHQYSIGKLSALQQFHVSRRIAPLITTLAPVFIKLSRSARKPDPDQSAPAGGDAAGQSNSLTPFSDDLQGFAELLLPFADGLASMNDDDAEYVIGACMSAVQRKGVAGWTNIWAEQQKMVMFQDIDMSVMMPLAVRIITSNLGPFINGLLTSLPSSPEAPAAAG